MTKDLFFCVGMIKYFCSIFEFKFIYLMGVAFRYILNGFGPEVYFATTSGKIIFIANMAVCITIMLSLDTPASMSFKIDTLSVAANPILNKHFYLSKIV
jgi:hypothetical protein